MRAVAWKAHKDHLNRIKTEKMIKHCMKGGAISKVVALKSIEVVVADDGKAIPCPGEWLPMVRYHFKKKWCCQSNRDAVIDAGYQALECQTLVDLGENKASR